MHVIKGIFFALGTTLSVTIIRYKVMGNISGENNGLIEGSPINMLRYLFVSSGNN